MIATTAVASPSFVDAGLRKRPWRRRAGTAILVRTHPGPPEDDMSLFHRRRDAPAADARPDLPSVAGLADFAAARDWQQVSDRPFCGHLEDAVHEIARVMYR